MWCPNCKTEYQDGIVKCADCGADLVEGTADDFLVVDLCEFKDEETADRFIEYLEYSDIKNAKKKDNEENGAYIVTVPESDEKKAEKLFRGFLLALEEDKEKERNASNEDEIENYDDSQDAEDELSEDSEIDGNIESEEVDEDPEDILYTSSKGYTKKSDEYKDMKFSGITFILFGVIGLIYMALCKLEILPISYNIAIFVIICILFTGFIIMGIMSVVKSGKIKLQIPEEEAMTDEITSWLKENLTQEKVDSWTDDSISEVENDLLITSHIRGMLVKQYPDQNVDYLEMIADEFFNENFVEEDEETEDTVDNENPEE